MPFSRCLVSVPFYTSFLPLLPWSGHGKLARQMTMLIAFCDYLGNCLKDVVSAPRPASQPVRTVTASKDEEDNALEYGLPSSHTLNAVKAMRKLEFHGKKLLKKVNFLE